MIKTWRLLLPKVPNLLTRKWCPGQIITGVENEKVIISRVSERKSEEGGGVRSCGAVIEAERRQTGSRPMKRSTCCLEVVPGTSWYGSGLIRERRYRYLSSVVRTLC